MKIKFLPLILLVGLYGCDDTSVDQVAKSCTDAGVDGNNQDYCACVSTAVEPSAELLAFYSGLSDLRGNVVSVGDLVSKGSIEVTIQSTSTSNESICKSEGDSTASSLGSRLVNVVCMEMGEYGLVNSEDPSVCGAKTVEESRGKVEAIYSYGCSYLGAPDSSEFLTLTMKLRNGGAAREKLLTWVGATPGAPYITPEENATLTPQQSRERFLALVEEQRNYMPPPVSPYETVDSDLERWEEMLSQVKNEGLFEFGSLLWVKVQEEDVEKEEIGSIVNHNRSDFLKRNQSLSAGEEILSKVTFLTPADQPTGLYWSPDAGGTLVNLNNNPVSEKLLAALFPDKYSLILDEIGTDISSSIRERCQSQIHEGDTVNALDLL